MIIGSVSILIDAFHYLFVHIGDGTSTRRKSKFKERARHRKRLCNEMPDDLSL